VIRARIDAPQARRLAWIAVAVYLVALGVAAVLRVQTDLNVYYRAGGRVLEGAAIYRLDESSHFLYAPIFAIAFAPLAAIPLRAAQFAWYLISAGALLALVFGSARVLFGKERRLNAALIVLPILFSARFINNNIEHGQINLPTLALTVWAIVFGEEDCPVLSGLMLAAAVLIKPFAALAALFLLLERKWRPIAFAAGFGAVLIAAPALLFGIRGAIEQTVAYVQVVASMTDRYTLMLTNQSAASAAGRIMLRMGIRGARLHDAVYIGTALELVLAAALSLWYLADRDDRFQLAAFFCIMPSFVPISWKSYYAALLVPYMLLIAVLWTDRAQASARPTLAISLLAISVLLNWVPGGRPNHIALFYSAHFVSSLMLLAAVFAAERWSRASGRERIAPVHAVNG
jgi:hypothetical protein